MVGLCFHVSHGSNVILESDRHVARRFRSFANGIAFSHRPLCPGETFLFEIEDQELGWAGHVRCGVTLHNPTKIRALPQYLLPDFAQPQEGKCAAWVFAIKPSEVMPFGDDFNGCSVDFNNTQININLTSPASSSNLGSFDKQLDINYKLFKAHNNILPTDIGSRIGIHVSLKGELYFFVNGRRFGPCASDIPIDNDDVFAVVDLYGVTKQIRVVQVKVPTLEEFCGAVIKRKLTHVEIGSLDLPIKIKERLQAL
eukprot:gene19083-20999_t